MEVEDTHSFVIQGGVIAHNCADEARYFCMSRPIKPRVAEKPDEYYKSPLYTALNINKEDLSTRTARPRMQIIEEE